MSDLQTKLKRIGLTKAATRTEVVDVAVKMIGEMDKIIGEIRAELAEVKANATPSRPGLTGR